MAEKQIKSHDGFFINLFSKRDEVREFLEKTTPLEIVKKLHLDTLKLDTTKYVDSKLKQYFADIVYNCDYTFNDNETKTVKITLLFEHKSYKPHIPQLQLIKYIFNVLDTQINQAIDRKVKMKDFRLQPIIPIIFYHGTTKWDNKPFENYFDGMDDYLIKFLPKFDYHLIDMVDYPNETIMQMFQEKQLQIGLLLMKNIFHDNTLLDLLKYIFSNTIDLPDKQYEREFYESITSYIYHSSKINIQKFIEIMETMTTQHSKTFISTAMQLKMEGELKGRIEGIENEKKRVAFNLITEGLDNQFIKKITGLSILQIKYIRTLDEFQINTVIN